MAWFRPLFNQFLSPVSVSKRISPSPSIQQAINKMPNSLSPCLMPAVDLLDVSSVLNS